MMRLERVLFVMACVSAALPARADDGGGGGSVCVGADTYAPRGDKWFLLPTDSVPVLYQPDGPVQPSNIALPGSTANAAIQQAFNIWTSAACAGSSHPNIRLTPGSWANRDNGDNKVANAFQHVVYFVPPGYAFGADQLTVALTTVSYQPDNNFTVDCDMSFNNQNFNFRVGNTGCTSTDSNCYDVGTVALHEAGHFLGFDHVACTDSIMFPAAYSGATYTGLSHSENAGICALYPPRTSTSSLSGESEGCKTQGDCAKGLDCLLSSNVNANNPNGWCAKPCSSTNDCGNAYVCGPLGPYTNHCHPGWHLPDVPVRDKVVAADDLCAPCTDGAQCVTGLCGGQDSSGHGLCTQVCTAPSYACPDGSLCSPTNVTGKTVCLPSQPGSCQALWDGVPINQLCTQQASAANPNAYFHRDCESGLACFTFISQNAACVDLCDPTDPTLQCDAGFRCCYGVNANGSCVTSASPTVPQGGCFQTRVAGDSCVLPNQSICSDTTSCFTSGTPENARCYNFCDSNGSCGAGETCVNNVFGDGSGNALAVCCEAAKWDPKTPSSCVPRAGPCLRQESVTCNNNGDCLSNYCLKLSSGAACSVSCQTDADCTAAGVDVNNDGVGDAGSHCDTASGNHCVPNGAPVAAPACATPAQAAAKQGCGNCAEGGPLGLDGLAWGAVLLVCALRQARRRADFIA